MRRILAAGAALLMLAGCGGPGGGSDQSSADITVGVIADLTGPTAGVGKPTNAGVLAYIDSVNAKGGIGGHKIKALNEDYAYKVPIAEEKYKKFVSAGAVAVMGWGTADTEALRPKIKEDQIPFMSASFAKVLTDPMQSPFNFVVAPTYSDQIRIALDQIASLDPAAQVAVFHHDSPFGTAPLADGQDWIETRGYRLGYRTYPMKAGSTDYVGILQQAKDQGAKYIIIQNVASPAAIVAKNIADQKLDMKIVCLSYCSDETFIRTAGAAAENHLMVQPFAPPGSNKPGHRPVREYCQSKGINLDEQGLYFVLGWYMMHVMVQGIDKVVTDGKDITGVNIRTALETMPPVDTGGVIGPVQFSPSSHRGTSASNVYRVSGGTMTEVAADVVPKS